MPFLINRLLIICYNSYRKYFNATKHIFNKILGLFIFCIFTEDINTLCDTSIIHHLLNLC